MVIALEQFAILVIRSNDDMAVFGETDWCTVGDIIVSVLIRDVRSLLNLTLVVRNIFTESWDGRSGTFRAIAAA